MPIISFPGSAFGRGGGSPPTVTSISPVTYNGEQGTLITVNGTSFITGAVVRFISNTGSTYIAGATNFISSTQLTATTPQDFTTADEPLDVSVTNTNGLSFTLLDCLDAGSGPTWVTASGSLGTTLNGSSASYTVSASDPDSGATISYAVTTGAVPTGMSLAGSTGVISGTPTGYTANTTVTFSITATDNAGNSAGARSFSITVNATNYFGSGADGAAVF
jgi:hypothetical protein